MLWRTNAAAVALKIKSPAEFANAHTSLTLPRPGLARRPSLCTCAAAHAPGRRGMVWVHAMLSPGAAEWLPWRQSDPEDSERPLQHQWLLRPSVQLLQARGPTPRCMNAHAPGRGCPMLQSTHCSMLMSRCACSAHPKAAAQATATAAAGTAAAHRPRGRACVGI